MHRGNWLCYAAPHPAEGREHGSHQHNFDSNHVRRDDCERPQCDLGNHAALPGFDASSQGSKRPPQWAAFFISQATPELPHLIPLSDCPKVNRRIEAVSVQCVHCCLLVFAISPASRRAFRFGVPRPHRSCSVTQVTAAPRRSAYNSSHRAGMVPAPTNGRRQ